jgi:hypothetical protein
MAKSQKDRTMYGGDPFLSDSDPYDVVDPVLMPWAKKHGIRVAKLNREYHVRSVWVFDRLGNQRAQMWLSLPTSEGEVTVIASALDPSSPTKWGPREERRATLSTLEGALEELRPIIFNWSGPGAFT